ncbi:MAG TPA: hypothetical protein VGH20_16705 [Myxococcales bacterium]|jgi:hypothetical protein
MPGDGWDSPPQPRDAPKARPAPSGTKVLLSCLGACVVLAILATVVLSPWGFYLGGHFHLYPRWQGFGRLHSTTAGDFVLFVSIVPGRGGSGRGKPSGPQLTGTAVLCTPRGERYDLWLGGEMERHFGLDFQGRTVELHMRRKSFIDRQLGKDLRPKLQLTGRWNNPDLVMDDGGTLARGFEPDGSINAARLRAPPVAGEAGASAFTGDFKKRPPGRETVQVTLREAARADFEAACAAAKTSARQ